MEGLFMSCAHTECLDCGHFMNHRLEDECEKCGSKNVNKDYETDPRCGMTFNLNIILYDFNNAGAGGFL